MTAITRAARRLLMSTHFMPCSSSSSFSSSFRRFSAFHCHPFVRQNALQKVFVLPPPRLCSFSTLFMQTVKFSAQKLVSSATLAGLAVTTVLGANRSNVVYAMDEDYNWSREELSEYMKDKLSSFWVLAKKYQLPLVLLIMVYFGWRRPITLAINIALFLFCTRPDPLSVYLSVGQLWQRDMERDPRLYKLKPRYVKSVEVKDYKFMSLARVELGDVKLVLVGILGGWWVLGTQ